MPVTPPTVNRAMKPKAKSIGVFSWMDPPHMVAAQEKTLMLVGTAMTAVAAAEYDRRIAEGLTPMPRWGEPADVGRAVAALASGAFGFSTGDAIHVDGGFHVPRL